MTLSEKIDKLIENDSPDNALILLRKACVGTLVVFSTHVTLLTSDLNAYEFAELDEINNVKELKKIKLRILKLANKIESFQVDLETDDSEELFSSALLINDSFPFLNRAKFRKKIKKILESDVAEVLFVKGAPKSGMSYLEKYIRTIASSLKILSLIPVEIPAVLGEPDIVLGEKLAKTILNEIGVEIEFDESENEQFKFTQFINKMKDCFNEGHKVPVFFLHDFHKIEDNNENLLEFIFTLIRSVKNDFPKAIFIIAGFNYESIRLWSTDLKYTNSVYTIEQIELEDVKTCLSSIFSKYESEIKTIHGFDRVTEEDYIEGMIAMLIEDSNNIDISSISQGISEHLMALKE